MNYKILATNSFKKTLQKLTRNNPVLEKRIQKALKMLSKDPLYKGLKTHKVHTPKHGDVFSSRVTGDIRIIWDYRENRTVILALEIGGHSGKKKVY